MLDRPSLSRYSHIKFFLCFPVASVTHSEGRFLAEIRVRFLLRLCPICLLAAFALARVADAADALPEQVEFNRDIRPILSDLCFQCHGPDQSQRHSELRLDTEAGAHSPLQEGRRAIVAGKPDQSELLRRIGSTDPNLVMPPPEVERRVSARQKELLTRWIQQGARWEQHWSFVTPVQASPPSVVAKVWPNSPVDTFVLSRLEAEGLAPAPEAYRLTLLRRVTLDLTGLPPSTDDVDSFAADTSPDAFERVVDRLLASPRHGERMAIRWLNAARYADTSGYQSDGERVMWRWRDWVIDAFNHNLPFDQFTVEQLAGDLLPSPTLDQRIATGFNRNHRGNAEGGIIPEEFAVEYVVDRVETTATVWLGLTAMCARCHNHKFDPLAQKDFYQLYAFFNNVPEKGRAVKFGNSPPFIQSPTRDQQLELVSLEHRRVRSEAAWQSLQDQVAAAQSKWERTDVPDVRAADSIRRGLILHLPLNGDATAAFSAKMTAARPEGYLGQARPAATSSSSTVAKVQEEGNPRFAAGRFGQALDADGEHYAVAGDIANFGFFDRFSVSAWIKPKGERGGTIISRMTDAEHGDGWCLVLDKGKLQVHFTKRWLDDACRVETVDANDSRDWQHVAITYDGQRETAGIKIYVNGQCQPTVSLLDELNQTFENKSPLRIGAGNGPQGRFHGLIADVRIFDRMLNDAEAQILAMPEQLSDLIKVPVENRLDSQRHALREFFIQFAAEESMRGAWSQVHQTRDEQRRYIDLLPTTMVMQDVSVPRAAHVLVRGEYDKPGEPVSADVPVSLPPLSADAPRNRLGLARWLFDPSHPLTSRVAVNRVWQMLFGTGLVKTVDDFGQQGEWPSHPALLDWLAVDFRQGSSGGGGAGNKLSPVEVSQASAVNQRAWDVKRLIRMISTSAAYRQSSKTSPELQQRDPENRLLARGPRFRLSAEMIRDQALAASGLLVEQLAGPSVKPYQPEGLWKDLAGLDYEQDHGPALYRRSLYTFWKRTVAPPAMLAFDAGGRETCIVKESRTNTPLQALNLLNDITYVEASRLVGERMLLEGRGDTAARIVRGYALILARPPQSKELAVLTESYERHLAYYQSHPEAAEALTRTGEFSRSPDVNVVELAACSTIAGLILNLDEAVTRE